jgi:uncharacterized protein (UPF0332 family)
MDPRDFVRLASTMSVAMPIDPARCRTAISRAYHGAFHCASEALAVLGVPIGRGSSAHGRASRLLQASGDNALKAAGDFLQDLHRLRIVADYRMSAAPEVETVESARVAVEKARRIVDHLDDLLADPTRRAQATATIRANYQAVTGSPPPSQS